MDEDHQQGPLRYFFVVRWPDHDDNDEDGTLFLSKSAALAYARRIVRELKEVGGYDGLALTMVVEDENGTVIHSIPF